MSEHTLKTWPEQFEAVRLGLKNYEVRRNDRGFALGDTLHLVEYDVKAGAYSGRELRRDVTWLTDNPEWVKEGFVVMGLSSSRRDGAGVEEGTDAVLDALGLITPREASRAKVRAALTRFASSLESRSMPKEWLDEDGDPHDDIMRVVNQMRGHDTKEYVCSCDRCLDAGASVLALMRAARARAEAERDAARAEAARLREAMEPFAACAEFFTGEAAHLDSVSVGVDYGTRRAYSVKPADFLRAAAALSGPGAKGGESAEEGRRGT